MNRPIFLLLLLISISTFQIQAQSKKKKATRLQVEYFKDFNHVEKLVATIRVREDRYVPLSNANIHFYSIKDTTRVLLGSVYTDSEGKAVFIIEDKDKLLTGHSGEISFDIEYKGNGEISSSNTEITLKRVNLSISFIKIDTIKSIEILATEKGLEDAIIPVNDLKISFYIKGTFSLFNIGNDKTNEAGMVRIDFPDYMPGDTTGVMTIVAKVVEDEVYGNIEVRDQINWGIPVTPPEAKHRGLGDTDAPLWMVYTLIILLSAVWFHYLYVIFLIIKIKLARRNY